MIDEPFASGASFLHRADPRAKLLVAVALSCILAASPVPSAPALALPLGLALAAWARLPLVPFARRMLAMNLFVAFLWLFLPFGTPGNPVWRLGPLAATDAGLAQCLLITLKTNAIALFFLALIATSDAASLGQAMHRLRVPHKLVFLFLFTYRFINVIHGEHQRLMTAARLRGFTPRTSLHTYRTLASLLALVLLSAMRRAEATRRAMLLRCFAGRFATLRRFRMGAGEYALLGLGTLFCLCLAAMEILNV